ncbi:hypothetical protein Psesu_1004 [Pseudoxanthomonas suwonensis 11-1]|uniref:Lipoprotein n=1 Tax=Pseudoxanthomonas suwonensis (strain 11-1) TaxID=743721 RepID=E6WRQ5_PSEUU|nr:hypothetical protein [Pseudoxanthomonas suwonensis]ADV26854.1 hypothetical protein Psesu_1004 [Pseudoxanthomonas suwonensis 11-1]
MSLRKTPVIAAVLSLALAGCASVQDDPLNAHADCLVGGEKGPVIPGQPTSGRDRRCNPEQEAVLWSSEKKGDMKLDLPRRGD